MTEFKNHINTIQKATEAALKATGYDGLWIYSGHPENHFLDDHAPAFQVNPHFNWWVPDTDISHSLLHIVPGQKPTLYLSQPADFWHKILDRSTADWAQSFEVHVIHHQSEMPAVNNQTNHAWIGDRSWQPLAAECTNPDKLLAHLHFSRVRKTPYEIDCIQQANRLALKGHQAAADVFYAGGSEYDINAAYLQACQQSQNQMPYGNIVALNENAAVLHYQYQATNKPAKHRTFLIDAGASYHGYAADITRTYAFDKSGEFNDMITAMDELQVALCDACLVGQDYIELHQQAHLKIATVLSQFKVINGSAESAVESGLSATFFPHGLGHYLGLQVHDVAGHQVDYQGTVKNPPKNHPFLRLTDVLRDNAVITIEPGLYFIPMLLQQQKDNKHINWDKVEQLLPYGGIRIEDNVVVGHKQSRNLTRS
ncbi:MAG: Xaa-Pro dipeptidase [Proteobacteria bacterium]|nr:MAG: Xaa-Pro dipeptidase [Pseudomonadota bacterium]